jgi:hypothetical protein
MDKQSLHDIGAVLDFKDKTITIDKILLPMRNIVNLQLKPVGTLKDGYVRKVPLPQAPRIQHASHITNVTQDTCYLAQVPHIPTWSDLTGSLAGLGRRALLPFSLALM